MFENFSDSEGPDKDSNSHNSHNNITKNSKKANGKSVTMTFSRIPTLSENKDRLKKEFDG